MMFDGDPSNTHAGTGHPIGLGWPCPWWRMLSFGATTALQSQRRTGQGCRGASGLPMASCTLKRHRAVGSRFVGRRIPLRDAGYRRTTLDAPWGR